MRLVPAARARGASSVTASSVQQAQQLALLKRFELVQENGRCSISVTALDVMSDNTCTCCDADSQQVLSRSQLVSGLLPPNAKRKVFFY